MSNSHRAEIIERHDEFSSQGSSSNATNEQAARSHQNSNRDRLVLDSTNYSQGTQSQGSGGRLYPPGDYRNGTPESQRDIVAEIMVSHLANIQEEKIWVIGDDDDEGVVLKKTKGNYTCAPPQISKRPGGFFDAILAMNVRVSAGLHIHHGMILTTSRWP